LRLAPMLHVTSALEPAWQGPAGSLVRDIQRSGAAQR